MSDILSAPSLTVRATTSPSARTGGRDYALLDADGHQVGEVTAQAGPATTTVQRLVEGTRATRSGAFDVRDTTGALVFRVTHRAAGLLGGGMRGEVALADGRVVVIVTTRAQDFTLAGADGVPLATGARAGRLWLRVTGPDGPYAEVDREANTLTAQRAGTAHPHSQVVRFDDAVPLTVRLGTLAALVMRENRLAV